MIKRKVGNVLVSACQKGVIKKMKIAKSWYKLL